MPLLFDRGRLLEECTVAARVLRCVEAGDHGGLARALEALMVAFIERTQPPDAAEDRRDFVDLHPAADGPLAAFDRIRGRVVSQGPDFWLAPSKRRAPKVLAEAARALREALGREPSATIVTGSQAKLLRALGYRSGHYPGKLRALAAKGFIRLEPLPLGEGEKQISWRMEVLDADRARNRNG
jgi:hypothetical protein